MSKNYASKVIEIALAEDGYLEKSTSAYRKNPKVLDKKTEGAGSDNYTKYGRDMKQLYPKTMDFPAAWCDCFVDWCFQKAYGVSNAKKLLAGQFDDYTVNSANLYKGKKSLDTTPKVGSQVFFTKNGQSSGCYHTGLVYKVDSTYFYTIEGNTSSTSGVIANGGCVAKKKYNRSAYKGRVLFGHPKYDKEEEKTTTTTTTKKVPKIAKPTLQKGSVGTEVKRLQKDLNYLGFKGSDGKKLDVDGEFGTNTFYALKSFQKKYSLEVDGIYGNNSYKKMKSKVK